MNTTLTHDFIIEECCVCGAMFGLTKRFRDARLKDKAFFHCPNGHRQSFIKGVVETLNEELSALWESKNRLINDKITLNDELNRQITIVRRLKRLVDKEKKSKK